eukprot:92597-Chlamydomonas_euryale.AAC.2
MTLWSGWAIEPVGEEDGKQVRAWARCGRGCVRSEVAGLHASFSFMFAFALCVCSIRPPLPAYLTSHTFAAHALTAPPQMDSDLMALKADAEEARGGSADDAAVQAQINQWVLGRADRVWKGEGTGAEEA